MAFGKREEPWIANKRIAAKERKEHTDVATGRRPPRFSLRSLRSFVAIMPGGPCSLLRRPAPVEFT